MLIWLRGCPGFRTGASHFRRERIFASGPLFHAGERRERNGRVPAVAPTVLFFDIYRTPLQCDVQIFRYLYRSGQNAPVGRDRRTPPNKNGPSRREKRKGYAPPPVSSPVPSPFSVSGLRFDNRYGSAVFLPKTRPLQDAPKPASQRRSGPQSDLRGRFKCLFFTQQCPLF